MKDVTGRLARAASAHPLRTLALWGVALLASVAAIGGLLGSTLTTEAEMTNDPESYRGYDLIAEHFPPEPDRYVSEVVIVRSEAMTADDPAFERRVRELAGAIRATGTVAALRTGYDPGEEDLVSPDRRAVVVAIGMGANPEESVGEVVDVVDRFERDGFETAITGEFTADRDFTRLSEEDLQQGELQFGLPAALLVLLLVFGSVVAGLVPVAIALVAIAVALGLTALLGQAFDLSVFVVNMISGMGLALGIDYALFSLSRFREERRLGLDRLAAIDVAGRTAHRAILFSGSAFVLAMLGMVLVPDTILRSLAAGAILVGVVTVVAALTLLPALLALLGDRVNALRVPWLGRRIEASAGVEGRYWSRVVRAVMRAPLPSAAASLLVLVLLAVPVLRIDTGLTGIRDLPDRFPAKQGFLALDESFGVGTVDTVEIAVAGDVDAAPVRAAIERLAARVRADGAFREPETSFSDDGRLAVVEAQVAGDSRDRRSVQAVEALRAEAVPAAFAGVDAEVLVTGETAEVIDYRELASRWLPIVFVFVLALSFVLLTVAFRSIVLPLVAIALNLLSVGAAYGLLVLVFLEGVGADLLGFSRVEVIAAWLPLFLFSVLFGLSMDYTVFLLSRMRERYAGGASTDEAVAFGVGSTARLITGAALIIVVVFVGFAAGDQVEFQQMGFGVAVSLLLDATLIRLVLLPAVLGLLGDRAWYLPRWLAWLPHVEIEGRPAAAER